MHVSTNAIIKVFIIKFVIHMCYVHVSFPLTLLYNASRYGSRTEEQNAGSMKARCRKVRKFKIWKYKFILKFTEIEVRLKDKRIGIRYYFFSIVRRYYRNLIKVNFKGN